MTTENQNADPLDFIKGMWNSMGINLPGMVTPTLDVDELEKRITDLKTVENWLKMNLNMLTISIQSLEMQRATLAAVKAISQGNAPASADGQPNPFVNAAALWPWNLMQPQAGVNSPAEPEPAAKEPAKASRATKK